MFIKLSDGRTYNTRHIAVVQEYNSAADPIHPEPNPGSYYYDSAIESHRKWVEENQKYKGQIQFTRKSGLSDVLIEESPAEFEKLMDDKSKRLRGFEPT